MKKLFLGSILVLLLSCATTNDSDLSVEYYNIGNGFLELNKLDSAIEYYNKSLQVDYNNNSSRYNLVLAYVKNGNYKEAIDNADLLLIRDSKNSDLLSLKAFALYSSGELEESKDVYLSLDKLKVKDFEVKIKVSKICYQLKDYDGALEYLLNVLQDSSYDGELKNLYLMAGKLYFILEDLNKSVEYYTFYISEETENEEALRDLVKIYREMESYVDEINLITMLLELEDIEDRARLYFRKGELYLLNSDFKNGYESLEMAKEEGFDNEDMIEELLETPDLIEVDKIRELFK